MRDPYFLTRGVLADAALPVQSVGARITAVHAPAFFTMEPCNQFKQAAINGIEVSGEFAGSIAKSPCVVHRRAFLSADMTV